MIKQKHVILFLCILNTFVLGVYFLVFPIDNDLETFIAFVKGIILVIYTTTICSYLSYLILRRLYYFRKINRLLTENRNTEAYAKLDTAIKNHPKVTWLEGQRAVVLNIIGYISGFERYADYVLQLPNMKFEVYYRLILNMQNVNDYLFGRPLRNTELFLDYLGRNRMSNRASDILSYMICDYYAERYEDAYKAAATVIESSTLFYKSIAASVLANISHKYQDIDRTQYYATIALENAPSDEMRELLSKTCRVQKPNPW